MGPVRAEVMWQTVRDALVAAGGEGGRALDVLDLGGGTGADAVRIAHAGHRVTVVDPSPDALASLHRRATEAGLESSVTALLGDAADLAEHVDADAFDLVLCHGVLEHVDDPAAALDAVGTAVRPDGLVSVVVPGRVAAVVSRAVAGDLDTAGALLAASAATWDTRALGPRRFVSDELDDLLAAHGLRVVARAGVRVLTDLVPSALVDGEPGARERLFALERLAAADEEVRPLAGGLQALARLDLGSEPPSGGNSATV